MFSPAAELSRVSGFVPRFVAASAVIGKPVLTLHLQEARRGGSVILGPMEVALSAGETLALTGPSGVGKTTLLRVLAGLERDFTGSRPAPDRIGMVFQEPVLLPWRTAAQNLVIACGLVRAEVETALDEVGLSGMGDLYPGQLSLGQQRRLALARGFASGAKILLMDEPFVSLDPATVEGVISVYERLRARHGVSTVLVTHSSSEVARLADRVLRLEETPARLVEP